MRSRTNVAFAAAALFVAIPVVATAYVPSVAQLDAEARSTGNRKEVADRIGTSVFAVRWPAEVTQISANELAGHLIVGVRVLGVKFHHPITRDEFLSEVQTLVDKAFAAAPEAEEVDLWASVPIVVGKGVVVTGDLAKDGAAPYAQLSIGGNRVR